MESISQILANSQQPTKPQKSSEPAKQESGKADYLRGAPSWARDDCHTCKGAGWLYLLDSSGKPDYSAVKPCPECKRVSDNFYCHSEDAMLKRGIDPQKTFVNWRVNNLNNDCFEAARTLASDPDNNPFLLIYGGTGNGKSHLVNAIAVRLHQAGIFYRFAVVSDLIADLKSRLVDHTTDSYVKILQQIHVLILDDWAEDALREFAIENLTAIISGRYRETSRGYPRPTVITTNLPIDKLPDRITSRFSEAGLGRVVLNGAPDFRMK